MVWGVVGGDARSEQGNLDQVTYCGCGTGPGLGPPTAGRSMFGEDFLLIIPNTGQGARGPWLTLCQVKRENAPNILFRISELFVSCSSPL